MTKGLGLFFVFYILVGQPALLGWMLNNGSLYQLAGLNVGVFFVAWLVSLLCKPNKLETSKELENNTAKVVEKSEEKVSRIEKDDGLAVVSLEKKQEVIVKTDKTEDLEPIVEGLVKNTDEATGETSEDKLEEKVIERPMRENVSIPKIVQPLSGHQVVKRSKREWMWGQRLVMLLTLAVAAVIAGTLWEFLGSRGVAIALFLGWILYLIIGKLFDVNGFYNVKKLFTNWLYIILIVAGIGFGIYSLSNNNSINLLKDKFVSYVKDSFKSEKGAEDNVEVDTGDVIYVFEGTGEVIVDTGTMDSAGMVEGEISGDDIETLTFDSSDYEMQIQPEVEAQPEMDIQSEVAVEPESNVEEQVQEPMVDDPNRQVTWGEAIKHLLQGYTLSKKTDKTFVYVAKSNELYPYFKTAQEKAMIGFDVNPNKNISCETYMSLKGILEGWKVNIYDRSQTRNIYWEKAYQLGKTNGCAKGSFVKVKNL